MPEAARAHHGLPAHEVVLLLQSDPVAGLTSAEAAERLRQFGPNVLPRGRPDGPVTRVLRQLSSPLVLILLVAGGVTASLGEPVDSAVIFGVVLLNTVIGYVQETRAQSALEALRRMVRTEARTVRDGRARQLPSEDLVPGDLVLVEAGDRVPADLRVLRVSELRVDESALTGESQPVLKDVVALPVDITVADRSNLLYAGTLVTGGSGAGLVVETGAGTELGEIHRLVGSAASLATPLTRKLTRFSRVLTVVILVLAAVTFAVGVARGERPVDMVTAAIALAVGAIPEGLPAAVTITLAVGVVRMARRRAVVRRLPAVETLGSVAVICTDKTGTLTENQMTVRVVTTPDRRLVVTGSGYAPDGRLLDDAGRTADVGADAALRWGLLAGAGCNDAAIGTDHGAPVAIGDPTEAAMLVVAGKAGLAPGVLASLPRLDTLPFSSERGFMATLHADPARERRVLLVKGASERVLELCGSEMAVDGSLRPVDRAAALREVESLSAEGLRVLATAVRVVPDGVDLEQALSGEGALVLTGLQAMLDPPRPAAVAAVAACRSAGIAVKMITGDHVRTAVAIATQVGLLPERHAGDVLTGADLAELSAADYPDAVDRATVLARVSPEQKLRLVEALQARGRVVAMTGDGVNDAAALRQADIGIAMGRSGTEVAKEAADMVLTDDDFGTIEAAVEEGRGVFDNLSKFIVWTLPTNMSEGLVILVAIAFGAALPILPTQILWINMTTAVLLGLTLAFEPKEAGIMQRPPRDPARPLLTSALVARVLLLSVLMVGATWWLFTWERGGGAGLAEARTAAVNLFVAIELLYLFSCRSLSGRARTGLLSNRWMVVGVGLQVLAQAALTYLPVMNAAFHTAPLSLETWLRVGVLAVAAWAVVALDKRVQHRTDW